MILIQTEPVICIDPGSDKSGVVVFDGKNILESYSDFNNDELIDWLQTDQDVEEMAIEGVASYGMPVGVTTFDTVEWIGRFREAFGFDRTTKIYRRDIKLFLCGTSRAKDTNVRQRILDIFPATGGGKTPQVGVKGNPGPLYGVKSHAFSALAVGLTYKYNFNM